MGSFSIEHEYENSYSSGVLYTLDINIRGKYSTNCIKKLLQLCMCL